MVAPLDLDKLTISRPFTMHLLDEGAWLLLCPTYLSAVESSALYNQVVDEASWRTSTVRVGGVHRTSPRLIDYVGDEGTAYTYSGTTLQPRPWPDYLATIRDRVRDTTQYPWNSVLLNKYRDGRDSIGAHSDDEPGLGPNPQVAALSLGVTRKLVVRSKTSVVRHTIDLCHGSLVLFGGSMQERWTHEIPKETTPYVRISLTFRAVVETLDQCSRAVTVPA